MRLVLVRHGQTMWSKANKLTSYSDIPLNLKGHTEARKVGVQVQHFLNTDQLSVFTSPAARARQTAELSMHFARCEISICEHLHELNFGDYEGYTLEQIKANRANWDLWTDGCKGGEPIASATARAQIFLMKARMAGQDVIAFTHGAFIRILLAAALQEPPSSWGERKIPTGSLTRLSWNKESWQTHAIGSVKHQG